MGVCVRCDDAVRATGERHVARRYHCRARISIHPAGWSARSAQPRHRCAVCGVRVGLGPEASQAQPSRQATETHGEVVTSSSVIYERPGHRDETSVLAQRRAGARAILVGAQGAECRLCWHDRLPLEHSRPAPSETWWRFPVRVWGLRKRSSFLTSRCSTSRVIFEAHHRLPGRQSCQPTQADLTEALGHRAGG